MSWRIVAIYLLCYVFLDWVSYVHPVLPLGITPWNPPASLSLFLLLYFGQRYWPWLFVGAIAADVIVRGIPAPWPALLLAAAAITLVYALAAIVLRRLLQPPSRLRTAGDLVRFLAVVTPATLLLAGGYVAIFTASGRVAGADFIPGMFRYWVGDLNGILVFTPALLVHADRSHWRREWSRRELFEIAAQAIAVIGALWLVFGPVAGDEFKFFYLLFLPLVWIAGRWALAGATLALLAIQLGLILAVQAGGYHAATFVQFQVLMLALSVTGLTLGALVSQRLHIETELRSKQAALNRALQFAAAGEMTSAMAHELNQPITALSNYLKACQTMLKQTELDRRLLEGTMDKAVEQAMRAGRVVHRLRDFFRRGSTQLQSVELTDLVTEAVGAVRQRAEQSGARVFTHVSPQLPAIQADPTQMAMVLHNLLVNAIEEVAAVEPPREIRVDAVSDAQRVIIAVQDNGPGPGSEDIFEPFVTSKPAGMGLGLAISRSLVRAHGGDLVLDPDFRGGARFLLTLPLDKESDEQ